MSVPATSPADASVSPPDADAVAITLAPMRRRHLRTVVAHERAVYTHPWTTGLFLSELARPETRSYVIARAGALLVGHCGVLYVEDEGHVTTVVVAPAWQGHGIATRMLLYQFAHAVARGAEALTLEVRVGNSGAQALYRRFGFVPAGIRKGYYPETGEDALIMWAHDIASERARQRRAAIEASLATPTRLDNLAATAPSHRGAAHPAGAATASDPPGDLPGDLPADRGGDPPDEWPDDDQSGQGS